MSKRARAGQKLARHRGVIERRDAPLTDFASSQPSWVEFHRGYFGIRPLSSRELLVARQVDAQVSHEISTRFKAGITSAMRVSLNDGRIFQLIGALNADEVNHWMTSLAIEDVSDYGQ
jgi:head-tail adaptor